MNFQFYVEKLKNSVSYKKFVKENKDAYFCSGFFVIVEQEEKSKKKKGDKQHFDFLISKDKKMFSFQLEEGCTLVPVNPGEEFKLDKLDLNLDFDFSDVKKLIQERMQKDEIKSKIQEYLFSLQKKDKKDFLVGTVFISGLGLIKICVNLEEMKITEFEKKSFMDMLQFKGKKEKSEKKK